jgi:hypothetical protein
MLKIRPRLNQLGNDTHDMSSFVDLPRSTSLSIVLGSYEVCVLFEPGSEVSPFHVLRTP